MHSLPHEVTLEIIKRLSLHDLCSLSSTCKSYRLLCCDEEIWFALFARKGLDKPETRFSFASWLDVYQRSLMGKRGAKYVLTLYSREYRPCLGLIKPIPLSNLSGSTWKDVLGPLRKNSLKSTEKRYLVLTKRDREFYCSIEKDGVENLVSVVVDKKKVYNILYRLFYHGICQIDNHVYQQFQP
jgi:hypothetical protein